jgi:hypothetical protein
VQQEDIKYTKTYTEPKKLCEKSHQV